MEITNLEEKYLNAYFLCLEDWSDEIREAGSHKEMWYRRMKDRGLRVKIAVQLEFHAVAVDAHVGDTRHSGQLAGFGLLPEFDRYPVEFGVGQIFHALDRLKLSLA